MTQESYIQYVDSLSITEQFQLLKIAHETRFPELREMALQVLKNALNPMMVVTSTGEGF